MSKAFKISADGLGAKWDPRLGDALTEVSAGDERDVRDENEGAHSTHSAHPDGRQAVMDTDSEEEKRMQVVSDQIEYFHINAFNNNEDSYCHQEFRFLRYYQDRIGESLEAGGTNYAVLREDMDTIAFRSDTHGEVEEETNGFRAKKRLSLEDSLNIV